MQILQSEEGHLAIERWRKDAEKATAELIASSAKALQHLQREQFVMWAVEVETMKKMIERVQVWAKQ